jgi:hypothetical protein
MTFPALQAEQETQRDLLINYTRIKKFVNPDLLAILPLGG